MRLKIVDVVVCFGLLSSFLASACSSAVSSSSSVLTSSVHSSLTIPAISFTASVSREQAIAIAGQFFPPSVILQSVITAKLWQDAKHILWQVSFDGFNTTQDILLEHGWDINSLPDNRPVYHVATINIDAQTGAILLKGASDIRLGLMPTSS